MFGPTSSASALNSQKKKEPSPSRISIPRSGRAWALSCARCRGLRSAGPLSALPGPGPPPSGSLSSIRGDVGAPFSPLSPRLEPPGLRHDTTRERLRRGAGGPPNSSPVQGVRDATQPPVQASILPHALCVATRGSCGSRGVSDRALTRQIGVQAICYLVANRPP